MKKTWKIYINYGTATEFEHIDTLTFNTKKDASKWAKQNGYPQKCVVNEEDWQERKGDKQDIVVCK